MTNNAEQWTTRVEHAAYGWSDSSRVIPDLVRQHFRDHAACAHCGTRIGDAPMTIRGKHVYHSGCAGRARAAGNPTLSNSYHGNHLPPLVGAPTKPELIAVLTGRAIPLNERCTIFDEHGGSQMETFARDCFEFDDVALRLNHSNVSRIPATIGVRVAPDGLNYIAMVHDSPAARYLLMLEREIKGVSIECLHLQTAPDPGLPAGRGIIITRAKLIGISIQAGPTSRGAAWFGTSCRVQRV